MSKDYDQLFKVLLIGDSGVGKSCVLLRYTEDSYTDTYISTIGVDFKTKNLEIKGQRVKLQIWDTAAAIALFQGQERFKTITASYYRGAHGIMLMYDVTQRVTFDNVRTWLSNVEKEASVDSVKMLVGCKVDLEAEREVTTERGKEFAATLGIPFVETSARENIGLAEAFDTMTNEIAKVIIDGNQDGTGDDTGVRDKIDITGDAPASGSAKRRGFCKI